ncbi:GNAT family N-acetyltransferase [Trebonia sp.]|uniref:GNAT family N-acetyltransferase n=1 Tax=Trebonia sp. TaxID=2767075 RepID=UPI002602B598|nr:GNAT family N-acetyltransferase [Trebonia sp.]
MGEFRVEPGSSGDVRAIQRRRRVDDVALRLSLESAERANAWVVRDAGEIVGIAVAHDSEEERYVGDLFVEPSYRAHGLGASLLEAAFAGGELFRTMLVDPADARALALALRFRTTPRELVLRFAGALPKEEELARMAAGDYRFEVALIDASAHGFALQELDRRARGLARPADHAAFARSATGQAFFLNGECVAYAYVWPDGRLGPLACASEAYLVQIFAYALVTLQRSFRASWCTMLIPGSNRRIARSALRAGLTIEETSVLATDSRSADLSTYVGYHRLLL